MNELKKQFKLAKWDSILISAIVIAVGVLCIAMPDRSADVLCVVFGCSLLAIGITVFVKSVLYGGLFTSTAIVLSISLTVTGIFCLVNPVYLNPKEFGPHYNNAGLKIIGEAAAEKLIGISELTGGN